jgi:hypothetical protein
LLGLRYSMHALWVDVDQAHGGLTEGLLTHAITRVAGSNCTAKAQHHNARPSEHVSMLWSRPTGSYKEQTVHINSA